LIHHIEIEISVSLEDDDVESLFFINKDPYEKIFCVIPHYQTPSETDSNSDFEYFFHISLAFLDQDPIIYSSQVHCPHSPIKLSTSKFAKPITAIALIDAGASFSILDIKILHEEY